MNKYYILVILAVFFGCNQQSSNKMSQDTVSDRLLWGTYKLGNENIGFAAYHLKDSSRFINDSLLRPLQVSVWYPTNDNSLDNLSFNDYFILSETELDDKNEFIRDSVINKYKALAIRSGVTTSGIDSVFSARMGAIKDASVKKGNYPVILVAQGNGHSIFNQAVLCEYLASYGYYVVSVPSPIRISGSYTDYEGLVEKTKEQADDLLFARNLIIDKFNLIKPKIGMLAYSFGGRSAITYLHNGEKLDALISWDSGLANENGKEWIDYLEDFNISNIDVPIAHFYQPGDRTVQPNFEMIKAFSSKEKYLIKLDSVNHGFFMIRGAADAAFENFQLEPYKDSEIKHRSLLSLTREFLDSQLKNSGSGLVIESSENLISIEKIE